MKLMVIDGNSILNRSFYAIRQLTTKSGLHTNAVFGFLTTLNKLLTEDKPDAVCSAFDLKEPTFRHDLYDGYKAARRPMPEELASQMPLLREILEALNINRCELKGFEADDVIGTIAEKCKICGWDCLIVTGDRDSLQLIDAGVNVRLITTRGGKTDSRVYDTETFINDYGFPPANLVDLKSIMGDSSDSIPGVKGIGEKGASGLITRFKTLSKVYENIESPEIKPALRKKLEEGREMAYLSYKLALIDKNAPLVFAPEDNILKPPDKARLDELFTRLEFHKLRSVFGLDGAASALTAAPTAKTVINWRAGEDSDAIISRCVSADCVSFAVPSSLDAVALIVGNEGFAFSYRDMESGAYNDFLREFLSGNVRKNTHGVKQLMRVLIERKIPFGGFVFDTELAAYLLNPGQSGYSLQQSAARLLSAELPGAVFEEPDAFGALDANAALDVLKRYAESAHELYLRTAPELETQGMHELFYNMELPLCALLAEMENTGFHVDRSALTAFGDGLATAIEKLQNDIFELCGEKFNINSTKQLAEVLFEKLELPSGSKTKSGSSTNIEVLEKLRGKHPVIEQIIDYRQLTKLKSTYADGLLKVISPAGRIHTNFNMTATATGRLSSTEPNLQNIPVRSELGGEIRRMFTAGEGMVLVGADYSQIELRVLAHLSGDRAMILAFESGEDIHAVTASQVFKTPLSEVTPLMRSRAKAVNFGIVFGMSDFSLAKDIKVSRAEAKEYIEGYFSKYSGVRQYMLDIVEKAKTDGYVSTLAGRRRYLPELKSAKSRERAFGERVALNMPVQGTAADIMKTAMLKAAKRLRDENLSARLLLQVHDELIVESPPGEAGRAALILTEEMCGAVQLSVPLVAEARIAGDWYILHNA